MCSPAGYGGPELMNFGYDNAFRITSITNTSNSALSWTDGYDTLDHLTSAAKTGTTYGWTYDHDGNRLAQTGTAASSFLLSSTRNEITSVTGALSRTYTYDLAGNTTSNGPATFTYNNRGRMVGSATSSSSTTYIYDALGQRIQKSGVPTGTVVFVYDESGHLLGEYNSSGGLIEETVWMGDTPVAVLQPNGNGGVSTFYVHADQLNAPRIITQPSSNTIVWRWDTDPFGTAAANSNPSGLGAFTYNLRFPGQYADVETGLNYNYRRDYDSAAGRYLESDPIGLTAGVNTYSYAMGSPVTGSDAQGLDTERICGTCALGDMNCLLYGGNLCFPGSEVSIGKGKFPVQGNWCGPTWTGGHMQEYTPMPAGYYAAPEGTTDAACMKHDMAYYDCRQKYPCDRNARASCMTAANKILRKAAWQNSSYLVWAGMFFSPDPGANSTSCGCSK